MIPATGVVGLAIRRQVQVCGDPARLVAVSLVMPAGLFFFSQPRLLPPILIGAGIAAGLCAMGCQHRTRAHAASPLGDCHCRSAGHPGDRASTQFADFYRVVDEPLVRAAAVMSPTATPVQSPSERIVGAGHWLVVRSLVGPARHRRVGSTMAGVSCGTGTRPSGRRAVRRWTRLRNVSPASDRVRSPLSGHCKWDWIGWERWLTTLDSR